MRYSASEKLEIIRTIEHSHLPVRHTLAHIGLPRATFYRWDDLYAAGGPDALADRPSRPEGTWNRIPDAVRSRIVVTWSRPAGQSGGLDKLGSGCHQAANFPIPGAPYASSGVPPASIECARRAL